MSYINIWKTEQDGVSADEGEVRLRNVHVKDSDHRTFETDSETLMAVKHIVEALDDLDNGGVLVITKDVW